MNREQTERKRYVTVSVGRPRTSARTTLHSSTENPPEEETSAIQILLGVGGRRCRVGRATILPRDALRQKLLATAVTDG